MAAHRIPHWAFSKEKWYKDYQTLSMVTLKPDAEAEKKKIIIKKKSQTFHDSRQHFDYKVIFSCDCNNLLLKDYTF